MPSKTDPVADPEFDRPLPGDDKREAKAARDDSKGTTVAVQNRFLDDDLRAITSFDDAVKLLGDTPITDSADLGNGFTVLRKNDKRRLVGVPFLILSVDFLPGDFGKDFASMMIVTKGGEKLIVNDGSTGIADQLLQLRARINGPMRGIVCKHGLRVSDYEYEDTDGMRIPASTYYLDTSA